MAFDFNDPKQLGMLILSVVLFVVLFIGSMLKFYISRRKKKSKIPEQKLIKLTKEQIETFKEKICPPQKVYLKTRDSVILKSDMKEGKFYFEAIHRDYFKYVPLKKKFWDFAKRGFGLRKKKFNHVLIRMQLLNNSVAEFFLPMDAKGFIFNNGHYIFDDTNKYSLITSGGLWVYDYHQAIDIPIKVTEGLPTSLKNFLSDHQSEMKKSRNLKIDTDQINEILDHSKLTQVKSSLNPTSLRVFLKSNFIQGLVAGASLGKIFRLILMLVMIVGFLILVDLGIDAWDSGLFEQISSGFKKDK